MRVVVGLGNPGPRYGVTRHNMGFLLLDRLARDLGAGPEEDREAYRVAWVELGPERIALFRPLLYMNRSGESLACFPESRLAGPGGHLVLLDDVWLPFGSLRFRVEGSAGGHRGLESVIEHLGTTSVPRLRLGIGGGDEEALRDYVLTEFTRDEQDKLEAWLDRASEGVRTFLTEGPDAAMNRYNQTGLVSEKESKEKTTDA